MNGQLKALASQDPVRQSWVDLRAVGGSSESTPPPEIILRRPGRLGHGLLTVTYRLTLPRRQEVTIEKSYSSVRQTHSYASSRTVGARQTGVIRTATYVHIFNEVILVNSGTDMFI